MAQSDKVQSEDIIEKDLFDNTIKSTSDLIKELKKLETGLKAVNKQSTDQLKANKNPKTAKEIKDVNKALDESTKSKKSLLAVEKEIKKLTDDEIKQNEILKRQEADRIAQLKALAVAESKALGLEEKLLAENKLLALERKKLTGEEKDYLEQLKRINTTIDANNERLKQSSDKLKQQKMNVGNYKDSVKEAIDESDLFTKSLGSMNETNEILIGGFSKMQKTLGGLKDGLAATEGGAKKLGLGLKALGIGLLIAALASIGSFFKSSREGGNQLTIIFARLSASITVIVGGLGRVGAGIIGIFSQLGKTFNRAIIEIKIFGLQAKQALQFGDSAKKTQEEKLKLHKQGQSIRKISKQVCYYDHNNNKRQVSIASVHKTITQNTPVKTS